MPIVAEIETVQCLFKAEMWLGEVKDKAGLRLHHENANGLCILELERCEDVNVSPGELCSNVSRCAFAIFPFVLYPSPRPFTPLCHSMSTAQDSYWARNRVNSRYW